MDLLINSGDVNRQQAEAAGRKTWKVSVWVYRKCAKEQLFQSEGASGHTVLPAFLILAILSATVLHLGRRGNTINYHRLLN